MKLEQCRGQIIDGLCRKCFNRSSQTSTICGQMYEVYEKPIIVAPIIVAGADEWIRVDDVEKSILADRTIDFICYSEKLKMGHVGKLVYIGDGDWQCESNHETLPHVIHYKNFIKPSI